MKYEVNENGILTNEEIYKAKYISLDKDNEIINQYGTPIFYGGFVKSKKPCENCPCFKEEKDAISSPV
jgi:hypothetical protein